MQALVMFEEGFSGNAPVVKPSRHTREIKLSPQAITRLGGSVSTTTQPALVVPDDIVRQVVSHLDNDVQSIAPARAGVHAIAVGAGINIQSNTFSHRAPGQLPNSALAHLIARDALLSVLSDPPLALKMQSLGARFAGGKGAAPAKPDDPIRQWDGILSEAKKRAKARLAGLTRPSLSAAVGPGTRR